jgi:hypothetical protein
VTATVWTVTMIACVATESTIPALVIVFLSAVWAALDSATLGLHKYRGGVDHPILAFFAILIFWIGFFPAYLYIRSRRVAGQLQLKAKYQYVAPPLEPEPQKAEGRSAPSDELTMHRCYLCDKELKPHDLQFGSCSPCRDADLALKSNNYSNGLGQN